MSDQPRTRTDANVLRLIRLDDWGRNLDFGYLFPPFTSDVIEAWRVGRRFNTYYGLSGEARRTFLDGLVVELHANDLALKSLEASCSQPS